ncbi:hypothetical protein TWF706_010512 [Orbilia oligospora]|nr:hypothetical protein TWF706_010512 [Orbilia oligospora]
MAEARATLREWYDDAEAPINGSRSFSFSHLHATDTVLWGFRIAFGVLAPPPTGCFGICITALAVKLIKVINQILLVDPALDHKRIIMIVKRRLL